MKKIFLTVLVAMLFAGASYAQIAKGTVLVGASSNLGFTSVKPDGGDSYSVFSIDGKVGYFFIDNLVFGANLGFTKVEESNSTNLGLFGRYYFNGKIFVGAGFNSYNADGVNDSDYSYTGIPIEVGYAAFITDNIAVEPELNYTLTTGDNEGSAFGLNVGFTLYLNRN